MLKIDMQKRFKSSLLAVAIAMLPMAADAAGLGKLTVVSALGQPLRAEIDLTASREEIASLSARVASAEAFRSAGVEYSPSLAGIRFAVDKRSNGQPFLQVISDRSFNEPFIDMLVEVNWASGRLVREYTFLLDPPDVFKKPVTPPPVATPELAREAAKEPVQAAPRPSASAVDAGTIAPRSSAAAAVPADEPVLKKSVAVEPKPAKAVAEKAAEKAPEGGATRLVKKGDTLAKIANEVKPDGINLDQMLVALFRSNKDAFDGGNMNRLRAGKILSIPDRDAVTAVEQTEARKVVVAQAVDFNAYRKKLAAIAAAQPAKEDAAKQAAAGKIAPRVEDKVPTPAAGKDKLEVSRTEAGKGGKADAGNRVAAIEEDLVARNKALKDANSRIADLEKNLGDLKKLAEMKSAAGAKLQEQAQTAKPVPEGKKAEPVPAAAPAAKPAETPASTPVAAAEKPVEPASVKPAESTPPPAKKPAPPPPPPPPPPPSYVEENPGIVFGGGGIIALLLGYLGYNAWRRKRQAQSDAADFEEATASTAFSSSSGQSVDTGASMPTDFSQESAASTAGDEGVDPVAEADVYMAYGRDSQAEEILLEALKTDPARSAIHLKLLEIYAARKSVPQFEAVARTLHGLTDGQGADWDKAAELGRSVDPANPLYGGGAALPEAVDLDATIITSAVDLQGAGEKTVIMPGEPEQTAALAESEVTALEPPQEETLDEDIPASLDFDLDLGAPPEAEAAATPAVETVAADEVASLDFDLDLGAEPAAAPAEKVDDMEAIGLDFDLGATPEIEALNIPVDEAVAAPAAEVAAAPTDAPPAIDEAHAIDFDFDLGATETPAAEPLAAAPAAGTGEDTAALDFDFDLGEAAAAPIENATETAQEVEVALELPVETPVEAALDVPTPDIPLEASTEAPVETAEHALPPLDLADISLDLDELPTELSDELPGEVEMAEASVVEPPVPEIPESAGADDPEVATKLELAQAYEEMGDKEGARELLNEVLNEGSRSQQEVARNKLALLG